ncbi:MAG: YybH family protein [Flavitalea sp.]
MKFQIIFLLTFLIIGCKETSVDRKAEGEKLMQLSREWSTSAASNNLDKTLSYWADDAVVMSPGQPAIKGKKAIREMMESTAKIPGFRISWEPLSVEVSQGGDMAYMIEKNQVTVNDSLGHPITEFNKAVTVWKKQPDGSWKNVVDIWNASPAN